MVNKPKNNQKKIHEMKLHCIKVSYISFVSDSAPMLLHLLFIPLCSALLEEQEFWEKEELSLDTEEVEEDQGEPVCDGSWVNTRWVEQLYPHPSSCSAPLGRRWT